MTAGPADDGTEPTSRQPTSRQPTSRQPTSRPRPRPQPTEAEPTLISPEPALRVVEQKPRPRRARSRRRGRQTNQLARVEAVAVAQPAQVVAAAGNALVGAAKIGRILGRSGWRLARQVPGVAGVETQAQRLRDAAAHEAARLLEIPSVPNRRAATTPEEQRALALVQDADLDPQPLRTAMSELLNRSAGSSGRQSREYLFGTIVSQLVPDEARIIAALAGGQTFAAVDVVVKQMGRASTRTVLANVSTVAAAAGVARPQDVGTYLTRLYGFGLVSFGPAEAHQQSQFDLLADDPAVAAAKIQVDEGRQGNPKVVRKSVYLSPLGKEFWAECAPSRPSLGPRPAHSRRPD